MNRSKAEEGPRCFSYAKRDARHPVVRTFAEQRLAFVRRAIPLHEVQNMLDVGCGSGFSSLYYCPHVAEVWGTDYSDELLARNQLPAERLVHADAGHLPFADNSFDLVMLHHVQEPQRVVTEMARVARKFVVLFEPNRYNPALAAFALVDSDHRSLLQFSKSYLKNLAIKAGLVIICAEVVGCIFPNAPPRRLAPLLRRVPFRIPFVGISNALVCRKAV